MAYTVTNFKSKKALRTALEAGEVVRVFQPGPFGPVVRDGLTVLEGPHFPEPHRWYAQATIKDGQVVGRVK